MATADRLPTSDGDSSGTITAYPTSSPKYSKVDDPVGSPDDASTYVQFESDGAYQLYGFSGFYLPEGSTITKLTLTFRIWCNQQPEGSWSEIAPKLKAGGSYYTGAGESSHDAWGTYTRDYTTNPKTGLAWTVDDINGVGANALQQFGSQAVRYLFTNPRITQVYATVTYTLPPESGSGGCGGACSASIPIASGHGGV